MILLFRHTWIYERGIKYLQFPLFFFGSLMELDNASSLSLLDNLLIKCDHEENLPKSREPN